MSRLYNHRYTERIIRGGRLPITLVGFAALFVGQMLYAAFAGGGAGADVGILLVGGVLILWLLSGSKLAWNLAVVCEGVGVILGLALVEPAWIILVTAARLLLLLLPESRAFVAGPHLKRVHDEQYGLKPAATGSRRSLSALFSHNSLKLAARLDGAIVAQDSERSPGSHGILSRFFLRSLIALAMLMVLAGITYRERHASGGNSSAWLDIAWHVSWIAYSCALLVVIVTGIALAWRRLR
jgi:hypothetical protein